MNLFEKQVKMQVEWSKLKDVKFSIFNLSAFQRYFAFFGPVRTDTTMLFIHFLILPIRYMLSVVRPVKVKREPVALGTSLFNPTEGNTPLRMGIARRGKRPHGAL